MHSEFMAFMNDETTAASVRSWAERQGFPLDTVRAGGADFFANLLESEAPPKLAIVDLDGQEQPVQVAARLVSLCGPATRLIATGSANDVLLYRNMLAAGLTDYLVKPLTPELLTQAMMMAARGGAGAAQQSGKEAKTIIILGVRGGVGASTTAVNLAWIVAHEMKKKCALLDLDLQYGTVALALDLEPGHGLRDVVSSPQRVDGLMIAGALVNESENLSVLSAEETVEENIHVDPGAIAALLKEMRSSRQAIFIDMPRHLMAGQKRILATAQEIALITEMSLAGIRDSLRIRTMLKGLGATGRITLVGTKVGPTRLAAVNEAAFAKGAQAKIDFLLPDDHKNVTAASNAGKMLPLVARDAPLTKALRDLAAHLVDGTEDKGKTAKKPGKLLGLFGGQGKESAKA